MMASKTNAVRMVQSAKIPFEEKFYAYDVDDLSGIHVAECISLAATAFFFCASYYIPHPTDYITEDDKTGDS